MAPSCSFCFKFIKLLGSVGLYFSSNLEKICQLFCHIFFRSSLLSCHPHICFSYMFFCLILIITKVVIFFLLYFVISPSSIIFSSTVCHLGLLLPIYFVSPEILFRHLKKYLLFLILLYSEFFFYLLEH